MSSAGTMPVMRWQRVLWLVVCGFFALVWLAGLVGYVQDYERPIGGHDPGVALDIIINLALLVGTLLLMRAPVGKGPRGRHERT